MKYRVLGRTGVRVSEVGLGGHREGVETRSGIACTARFFLPAETRARVVGRAIDAGVTYFDTTYGCEAASLGESLRLLKRRDGLFVSGMRVDFFKNWLAEKTDIRPYTRREVEACLRGFGQPSIDQFLLGAMCMGDPLSHPQASWRMQSTRCTACATRARSVLSASVATSPTTRPDCSMPSPSLTL